MEDIVAMKLSAIADNGSRLKDFIDIAFLSTRFPFNLMLRLYERNFPDQISLDLSKLLLILKT